MVVDRQPHYYGSRNMPDHHRDMRLDIDNMTYEVYSQILSFLKPLVGKTKSFVTDIYILSIQELLALGERIGSVNTGLSDRSITSCLLVTTYYPLYQTEDQRKCAICLVRFACL